jgi:hypothetical protein
LFFGKRQIGDVFPHGFGNADDVVDDDLVEEPEGRGDDFDFV